MTEVLEMTADADVESVVADNARERGEDDWTVLETEEQGGAILATVRWGSEDETIFYLLHRDATTEHDIGQMVDAIEDGPFEVQETPGGNHRVVRNRGQR